MSVHIERLDEVVSDFAGRLGRHVEHDSRSLAYAVENALDRLLPAKTVEWSRFSPILNQGDIGSCTGNAMAGWLGCAPHVLDGHAGGADYDEATALKLYELATHLDHIPGQYPPDDTGSSGLAVAKAAKQLGYISGYNHALSVDGLLHALQTAPVIVGVPWFSGFDRPDSAGVVKPTGQTRGGHEFLIRGYEHGATEATSMLHADNSWGNSWGVAGSFRFSVATWRVLAANQGDVTIPRV